MAATHITTGAQTPGPWSPAARLPWAIAVGALALLTRITLLGSGTGSVDSPLYERLAGSLVRGNGLSSSGHVFGDDYRTPGYPVILAGFRLLPGPTAAVTGTLQHLVGAALAVAVLLVVWRYLGRVTAVIAGSLVALAPLQLFVEQALLPDFAFGVAVLVAVALVIESALREEPRTRWLVGIGAVLVVAAYIKPNGLILVAFVPATYLLSRLGWRAALRATLICGVTVAVGMAPWVARNWIRDGTPVLTTQGGAALWVVAFDADHLPFPATATPRERVAVAAARQARVMKRQRRLPDLTYAQVFAALRNGGASAVDAADTMSTVALRAIRAHPGDYVDGAWRVLDLEFRRTGDARMASERLDGSVVRATDQGLSGLNRALADVADVVFSVWWWLTLGGLTGLALLLAADRRVRTAGAALVSAWGLLAVGTALTNTFDLRYAAQVAPLAWLAGTAGTVFIVRQLVDAVGARRLPTDSAGQGDPQDGGAVGAGS